MGNLVCKLKEGNGERSTSECGVRRAIVTIRDVAATLRSILMDVGWPYSFELVIASAKRSLRLSDCS